ncbi:MAG TPA: hypothetical protein VL651_13000 [Bacteroidia bacterium]|nr:hypothetical protein [Bacteroidia bacterium]
MKKALLVITSILICKLSFSTEFFKPHRGRAKDANSSRALSFGISNFDPAPLNGYLSQFTQRQPFVDQFYAIGYEDFAESYPIDAAISLSWLLPQESFAGVTTDSLSFKVGGWQLMTSILGFDLIKSDVVNFTIGPEFNWGCYKLKKNAAGEAQKKYTNPFVAPGGRVDLQFQFGKFLIGGRAMYCYDITDPKWKRKASGLEVLPGTLNRGLNYTGYIGLAFD